MTFMKSDVLDSYIIFSITNLVLLEPKKDVETVAFSNLKKTF